jgi:hypothetical protein
MLRGLGCVAAGADQVRAVHRRPVFAPEFMRRVVADRLGVVPDEISAGHAVAVRRN